LEYQIVKLLKIFINKKGELKMRIFNSVKNFIENWGREEEELKKVEVNEDEFLPSENTNMKTWVDLQIDYVKNMELHNYHSWLNNI